MAKFSLGRDDDSDGPSSPPLSKRQRLFSSGLRRQQPHQTNQQQHHGFQSEEEEEVEVVSGSEEQVESGSEEQDPYGESEHSEEDEGEEEHSEEDEGEEEQEREEEHQQQQQQHQQQQEQQQQQQQQGRRKDVLTFRLRPLGGPCSRDQVSDEPRGDIPIIITLSDPDVLDCPTCLEPLTIPVFQCENGHVACSSCSIKLRNKCPSCSLPIGYNRCRALEKVIESVKMSCLNTKYGCKEKVSYCKKLDHEEACTYAPCSCPASDCNFVGSVRQLSPHFSNKHPNSAKLFPFNTLFPINFGSQQKYVILQEQNGGQLFVLNNKEFEHLGFAITISSIQPSSSKEVFQYIVVARKGGSMVRLQSVTDNISTRVESHVPKRFLVVPNDFVDSCGQLKVDLYIGNKFSPGSSRGKNPRVLNQ